MKKLNLLLMMAVMAFVAVFCSCSSSEKDPMITITTAQSEIVIDPTDIVTPFLTGTITAEENYILSATFTVNFKEPILGLNNFVVDTLIKTEKDKYVSHTFSYELQDFGSYLPLLQPYLNNIESLTIDVLGTKTSALLTLPITIKQTDTPLVEGPFEWQRIGGNEGTGLEQFGLQWTSNVKTVNCIIKPLEGAKLVQLTPAEYTSITNLEGLGAAVEAGTALQDFRGVNADASGTYDIVLGTSYNGSYYLIHITSSKIDVTSTGAIITIGGMYKSASPLV